MGRVRWWVGCSCLPFSVACWVFGQAPPDPAKNNQIPSFTVPPVRPGVAYERFIVFGDFGTGRSDQHRVAEAMARKAKQDGLDFMVTVGDNFYENGVTSTDDPLWKTAFEDVYQDAALKVPVFASLGNHDHRGNLQAQIDYTKNNPNWRLPAAHYTFTRTLGDETTVQFFAIDSEPIKNGEPQVKDQLDWLDGQLAASKARWKFVFGHHPLYSHAATDRAKERETMIAAVEPILTRHKVQVYFAGHDHTLEIVKPVKGVHHVISGGAAGPDKAYPAEWSDDSYYTATLGGFVYCRVSKDELVIEFVRLDGATEYAHTLTP